MRTSKLLVVVAALSAVVWAPGGGEADAAEGTTCVAKLDSVTLDPGLGKDQGAGTFYNTVDGTIECDGPIHGRQPTGPGVWLGDTGHFEGSCAQGGKGTFAMTFSVPTKDGELRFGNAGPLTFGALKGGVVGGELDGDEATATFTVTPKKGDCVTAPITELTAVELKMTLKH